MRTEFNNLGMRVCEAKIVPHDYAACRHFIKLPAWVTRQDIFRPSLWALNRSEIKELDLLRVQAADGSFDFEIVATRVLPEGIVMKPWPIEPPVEAVSPR